MSLPSLYRTPEEFLADAIARVQAAGSRITDFTEGSGARTLYEGEAAMLSAQSLQIDQFQTDSFLATASGEALDEKAADYKVLRNPAVQATGVLRISRAASGVAVTIPAGWGQLQTKPVPGSPPATIITNTDAVFGSSDLFVDVPATALSAGTVGNVQAGTVLLPVNPVAGFQTDGGFIVQTTFTGGVEAETDDALRYRTLVTVQGRGNANAAAFEAAALAVPGVVSASVLQAGDARTGGSTVPAGQAEVYYEGSAGLLSAVQSAINNIEQINQQVTAITATAVRCYAALTVYALTGTDPVALAAAVIAAVEGVVNAARCGKLAYYSDAIRAIHQIDDVVSVAIPFPDLRKFADAGGTVGDISPGPDRYLSLVDADMSVAITLL